MSQTTNDRDLLAKPIFVIGAPRSGTSFLYNVLGKHALLSPILEPLLIWRYGNDSKCDMLRPEDVTDNVRSHIRSFFEETVRERGGQRLLEKSPTNALRMPFVESIFPDCRFIHIYRHGVDATLSIREKWNTWSKGVTARHVRRRWSELKLRRTPMYLWRFAQRAAPRWMQPVVGRSMWGPRIPAMRALLKDLDLLEVCALQWRMSVDAGIHYGRQLPADRYMEVKYEDISPQVIQDVVRFCELDMDPAVLEYFHEKYSKRPERSINATPQELDLIQMWTEPTLRYMGYEMPTIPAAG